MLNEKIEGYRLSPQQRRLWLLQKNSSAFHAQGALSLAGAFRRDLLDAALKRIVERHEILRTAFHFVPGMDVPLQVIGESAAFVLTEVDLRGLAAQEQLARLEAQWLIEREQVIDHQLGAPLHVCLLTLSEQSHTLILTLPAMCADAWAVRNVAREVARFYAAGHEEAEDGEVVQYADVSEWQNELLESDESKTHQEFWRKQSEGSSANIKLPLEKQATGDGADRPRTITRALDAELTRQSRSFAAAHGMPLATVFLSCWQSLLWRLTGEAEVVVETGFDARKYDGLDEAVGVFQKFLPVRCNFERTRNFTDICRRVDEAVREADEWQEYFAAELTPRGDRSDSAQTSAGIGFDYLSRSFEPGASGARWKLTRLYACIEPFKLRLSLQDDGEACALELHYDPHAYGEEDVQRLAGEFITLLGSVLREPEASLANAALLSPVELQQILQAWNDTAVSDTRDVYTPRLFEEQVERTPERVAVIYGDREVSFAELNRRANQLAHHLQLLGVGAETTVGLLLERSVEMLVGVLGIWKAGGAYVPLDPSYPQERLAYLLADAGVRVLLTTRSFATRAYTQGREIVYLDSDWERIARLSVENPAPAAAADNLAYVIYTSGSTGEPKGVMIQHRSVCNLSRALQRAIYVNHAEGLRISVNAPLSFDASVKQLIQLLPGHTLDIIPEELRRDGSALLEYIEHRGIEVLDCTPSQLHLLLEAGLGKHAGQTPHALLLGGEEVSESLWRTLSEIDETAFYNVYGPTECTVDATACRVSAESLPASIGRPLANMQTYVLDRQLRPVPVGVAGELCIGGAGLARGYLRRPDLTCERFIPDPFSGVAGARLYRTGDLARYLPDGRIEYLGRIDQQVKLRGFRIELGEIEATLSKHPEVREAVVMVREDAPGEKRLVGYVVGQQSAKVIEGHTRYPLPNGMLIVHQNRAETDYLYQEIFEEQIYFKHGVRLRPGACVLDVGANIGMFTLFISQHYPDARIYAFEPVPPVYEALRLNAGLYGQNVKTFNYGLSDEQRQAAFAYYPQFSARSGLLSYADAENEVDVTKAFLRNKERSGVAGMEELSAAADYLLDGVFESIPVECELKRLSDVIREEKLGRIDLLKIDVQRAELDVLDGIVEEDWAKVQQVVMEVHDAVGEASEGRLAAIVNLLERHGFTAVAEQDESLQGTDRHNLYAIRTEVVNALGDSVSASQAAPQISGAALSGAAADTLPAARSFSLSVEGLRQFLKERLPEHMVPTAFVIMDEFPLTTNAKVDRRALPTPEEMQSEREVSAPHTLLEELMVGIWRNVLHVEQIGVDENFFELGGHSLLATQLMSRVREAFQVEIPLRTLFEGPTVTELAQAVEAALRSEQHLNAPPLVPVSRQQKLPLSFAQQRLWFLDQMEPENPSYNVPAALRLAGHLNIPALEQTLTEIVRRHEVLRTHFVVVDGQPLQVIAPVSDIKLPIIDLRDLHENEREAKARQLASLEAQRPFQLHTGPLVRAELLRLDNEEHIVLFTMHHIVSDGWSMGVLIREVAALYEAFSQGKPSPLPNLDIQYADFAVWQREWLQGEVLEGQLRYWREQLKGAPPVLELPTDRPRPPVASYHGATHSFIVPAELATALRALSQREGVTLYMTLLAAFQLLLARHSGQPEIVVGTPIAGRNRAEIEPLIGFFVNTLVLRTDLSGEPTIIDLLRRVREVCLGAYAHQDLPFEMLVEQLQPQRSLSYSPLFQVFFVLQNVPVEELKLAGLTLTPVANRNEIAKFDLSLDMHESGELITGALEYNSDLFDSATVERLASHFLMLLRSIVDHPLLPVARLPLLPPHERELVLSRWNNTPAPFPRDLCLHHLFERQATLSPNAPAIVVAGETLTYAEVNERANRLAHHLRTLGATPDMPIALCLERGADQLVAVLGVLKAGGAYLPLDPQYPSPRLVATLRDAGARLLVTENRVVPGALREAAEFVVLLDADAALIAAQEVTNPVTLVESNNLAYVIYTSGSTGVPKGVAIEHRSVVNHNYAVRDLYELEARDRVLQFASLSFDMSVEEIFPTWLAGGAVVVRSEEAASSARGFFRELAQQDITVVNLTTSFWQQMVAGVDGDQEALTGLRLRMAVLGGEAAQAEGFAQARRVLGEGVGLINGYGPTETTVSSTIFNYKTEVTGEDGQAGRARGGVPIGKPIANTEAYVLDAWMQPVPVGVWGELYVGGEGVARGYLNRPHLTAERFVPHPFSREAGARLYRTGDVVRYLGTGELEFGGRTDAQVKVRGYRVELGEVEAALSGHAGVRECVVVVRADASRSQRLVAYVVAEAGQRQGAGETGAGTVAGETGAGEWRRYLKERLPEHMIPSVFVELEEIPLTPNGKVDRRALPEPEAGGAGAGVEYVAPRTVTEEMVSGMWAEVLGVERVGVNDDFFELGGHSLLATQVISRVRAAFGVEVALRELFEGPTVAELSHNIEAILRDNSGEATVPPLTLANRDEPLPLSFAQQRLWFLDQLQPDSPTYNIPAALRLRGSLDHAALQRTLSEIVRRHEALRTTFAIQHDEPRQLIHPPRPVELPVFDLSGLDAAERERQARQLIAQEAARPFNLMTGPLLRAGLVKLSEGEHIALLTLHHIVSDAWSMGVLVKEVGALYEAYGKGEESPLAELEVQYGDYAVWQREWLEGEALAAQLNYWRKQLGGAPAVVDLPTDRARPRTQTYRGAGHGFALDAELSRALKELSRQESVTLFMTLLAAWQVLLARYSGQEDISVGTSIAGRTRAETENLIGFFVNMLVLRTDLSGRVTFREALRRVREVTLGAYAHQDVPFEKLVEELQPVRETSHSPLFQVMMVMQHAPVEGLALSGLEVSAEVAESEVTKFDLSLAVGETSEGRIEGTIGYNTDLFDAATIERMAGHFERLLRGVVTEPEREIRKVPLLSEGEQHQLLKEWNETEREYAASWLVHRLFEEQVERTPQAIAVSFEGEQVTYRELNEKANQLAHYLRGYGVGPDTLVGICMERSIQMIVGLLGILKAGAAYVPLDPSYPLERLHFMLEDTGAQMVVTVEALAEALPHAALPLCLDTDRALISGHGVDNPPGVGLTGDNLAYVSYTSGSTGLPKGVAIPHRGVVRLVRDNHYAHLDANEVLLQFAPLSFDASTFEVWGSLLNGARLAIMPPGKQSLAELGQTIRQHGVTTLWLTAGLFQQMVDTQLDDLKGLRQLLAGGDVLSVAHVRKFLEADSNDCLLINGYGPTESTTFACCHQIGAKDTDGSSVPLGRPIAETQIYILDAELQPTPIGVAGELHIGGAGLARGYLNRPHLTAERFIPHPFSEKPGARLYRTGDLARYLPDGQIEFLGRIDHQVKVRGFRIELGEIEAVLRTHPLVAEVVVDARDDGRTDKRLVAYLVTNEGQPPTGVRQYLSERLPDYMMPQAFVELAQIPLTANGKVDRRALPEPEMTRGVEAEYVAPRGVTEEMLAGIWAEILGVERVGAEDNFFELGGHSLLATQVISRVRAVLNVEIPLRALFEQPTVRGLAVECEAQLRAGESVSAPPLVQVGRDEPLPLSFAQQRLWFLDQLQPDSPAYNIPAALRLRGSLDHAALQRSLSEIVRRHEALRTTFAIQHDEPRQLIHPPRSVELPVFDLSGLDAAERERQARQLIAEEAARPFDLTTGPLLRAGLVKLGEEEHLALLTMHHIVSDAWSMGVLVKEVGALYEAYGKGEESPLAELEVQYGDYAVWQREWLEGEALAAQLNYWRKQLGGAPAVVDLPTDRARPRTQTYRGAGHGFALDAELSRALKELSRQESVTLFMTLLAAFQSLLSRYSGQEDISVGTPIAGRTRAETENLIGFFVNTLVLRTDLSGQPTFGELLRRVREVTLGAYAHQDLPFEKLVEELQPVRETSHSPLFQVMMVMQNAPVEGLRLSGLEVQVEAEESEVAKFDLSLVVGETGERIEGTIGYNTDLFDAATIERMAGHFKRLLRGVVAEPEREIRKVPLLSEGEQQQLLKEWNETEREYFAPHVLHRLFEEQVERTPQAIAVVFEGEQVTYVELNERANRLAHRLQYLGVGPEVTVGVFMERSPEMVVALMGILKAGGAYLPLDPTYPQERLRFMLNDAAAPVLITLNRLADLLAVPEVHVIRLDAETQEMNVESRTNPQSPVLPEHPAYVIYTSGSTGHPKGVVIPHQGICNRLLWMQEAYQLNAFDRVLQKTPFSFDVSVWEFFWPLMTGACLVVAQPGGHQDARYLTQLIEAQEVTTLHFVPSMLEAFLEEEGVGERCRKVRRVICSGEALGVETARRFVARMGQADLYNLYGPTEASVDVTWWRCEQVEELRSVPIGRPIANTQIYVLDESMQAVTVGVAGELYIGGDGLARGYLKRPGLTAERFIPHPFSEKPGARLYRTGDLARYLPDGQIEFLGRIDHQVKVRGFRIELGEIEAVLRTHPLVAEAVVDARDDGHGDKRLVAYLVTNEGQPPTGVRQYLSERLPDYMMPQAFVELAQIPLTANGKVDRRALPEPEMTRGVEAEYVAPRGVTEEMLAGIWAEILGVERVGAEDNFFALGGHSLLATRVISRVRQAFGVEVPLREMFEGPTVAKLAQAIELSQRNATEPQAPTIVRASRDAHRLKQSPTEAQSSDEGLIGTLR